MFNQDKVIKYLKERHGWTEQQTREQVLTPILGVTPLITEQPLGCMQYYLPRRRDISCAPPK